MREIKMISLMDKDAEGKDITLNFKITQMSAIKQERWINRALTLFVSANAKDMASVQAILGSGKAENILGLLSGLEYDKVEPLYNELLECISYIPDKNNSGYAEPLTPQNVESILSSVKNLYKLRFESLKVNFGFLLDALQPQVEKSTEQKTITIRKNTQM